MKFRLLLVSLSLVASGALAQTNAPVADPDFAATFDRVVELVDAEELSAMEVASGSLQATKLFATGSRTVPYVEQRFRGARKESEAAVAGLYMTVHGKDQHLQGIQQELETNPTKRAWLKREVGTEEAFFDAVEAGAYWQDFFPLLPSTKGIQTLSRNCRASKDPLVRRAGLLWGHFFPDAAFRSSLSLVAAGDADPLTRRVAARLQELNRS